MLKSRSRIGCAGVGCLGVILFLGVFPTCENGCLRGYYRYREYKFDVGNLMASIDLAETLFKQAFIKDLDGDGVGEYANLEELCAWARGENSPKWALYLQDIDRSGRLYHELSRVSIRIGQDAGSKGSGPDAEEEAYLATAWPVDKDHRPYVLTFYVDQTGIPRMKIVECAPATPELIQRQSQWDSVFSSVPLENARSSLRERATEGWSPSPISRDYD